MKNNETTHVLARLETGFRTDSARLKELEKDLALRLQNARHFGEKHGSLTDWSPNWQQHWDNVERVLWRTKILMRVMKSSVESDDDDRNTALTAWNTIQIQEAHLLEALNAIRAQASGLSVAARKDWNLIALTLESHLETIHACAQALRIKLELLKGHSKEEMDQLVQDILTKLPNRAPAGVINGDQRDQEYREAATELKQERHRFGGFMDVVKSLLLWVETTDERVHSNRFLRVDEAELSALPLVKVPPAKLQAATQMDKRLIPLTKH